MLFDRAAWHKLTYIYNTNADMDAKVKEIISRIEEEGREYLWKAIAPEVKVFGTNINISFYPWASAHFISYILILEMIYSFVCGDQLIDLAVRTGSKSSVQSFSCCFIGAVDFTVLTQISTSC